MAKLEQRWWESRALQLALVACIALPLVWPSFPPFADVPGHMGSYHLALHLEASPALERFYDFDWKLIGNIGVNLLMIPMGSLFGVELGTKLTVLVIPVLTALGFLFVAREAHARLPATAAFALPLAYSSPLNDGFVNYCLAMAFVFLSFGLWLKLGAQNRLLLRSTFAFLAAIVIWLSHAVGWVLFGAICASAELYRQRMAHQSWITSLARTFVYCLPLLAPLALIYLSPSTGPLTLYGWFDGFAIARAIATILRDRWLVLDLSSAAILIALVGAAATRCFGLSMKPSLAFPALALFLAFIMTPVMIGNAYHVGERILPYALALAVLSIDTENLQPSRARLFAMLAVAFFVVRIAGTTVSLALYDRWYSASLGALDHVQDGSAIAYFTPTQCKRGLNKWFHPRSDYLGGLAIVRKNSFVNSGWALEGLHLVRIKYQAATPYLADPSQIVTLEPCGDFLGGYLPDAIAKLPRAAFDYIWLVGVPDTLLPQEDWTNLIWKSDAAALYAIRK